MIGCSCYDHIDLISFVRDKTAPVRPTGMMAGNITVQMDQLYGRQTAYRTAYRTDYFWHQNTRERYWLSASGLGIKRKMFEIL